MRDLAVRKGVRHMVGLQARGAREFNRVREPNLPLRATLARRFPALNDHNDASMGRRTFTRDWAYMADRSGQQYSFVQPREPLN